MPIVSKEEELKLRDKAAKQFFALGKELGYDPQLLKERAKQKFMVDSFTKLGLSEIKYLIKKLQQVKEHI
jgi:hypothetical protein